MLYFNNHTKLYIVCILITVFLCGCSQNNQVVPVLKESPGSQIETAVVIQGDIFELTPYDGKVYPAIEEVLYGINAAIQEVPVSLGDVVKKGDSLVMLDDKSLQNEIKLLNEQLEDIKTNGKFDDLQKELDMEILALTIEQKKADKSSAIEIAQHEADYRKQKLKFSQDIEIRKYEINKLQNKIVEKENALSSYKIIAPCDGKVVYIKETHINNQIGASDIALLIADYSRLNIQSEYLEVGLVNNAQSVYALMNGNEYQLKYQPYTTEELLRLKNTATGIVSNFEIQSSGNFRSGDYAAICLKNKIKSNVLSIPKTALNSDGKGNFVYTVYNGVMTRCDVLIGIETSIQVEIISGLKEGELVYVKG